MRMEGVRWSRIREREKFFCVRSFSADRETDLGEREREREGERERERERSLHNMTNDSEH